METKIEKHYQNQAKEIVDTLYDNGYFDREVKREEMRKVEDLLAYYLQSGAESAVRTNNLLRKIRSTSVKGE